MTCSTEMPATLSTVDALEEFLSRPSPELVNALSDLDGDLMVLGVGGKMGPSLAVLARRALDEAGRKNRVIGVSRFSSGQVADQLNRQGVETISCDLLDDRALAELPQVPNIIYMVGMKFGASSQQGLTWAMNAYVPGRVAQHFKGARVVLFSSGNIYPYAPVIQGGSTETTPPAPVGEYAQSVLGRERVFAHFATQAGTRGLLYRLNYAVEMRYGVLVDVARMVWLGQPIDLSTGHFNLIWQGDANAIALRSLALAENPPRILNVTGPEVVSVRSVATQFGQLMGKEPIFQGAEMPDALLSNAQQAFKLFGYPRVPLSCIVEWVAGWVRAGGPMLEKPTKYQVRSGKY